MPKYFMIGIMVAPKMSNYRIALCGDPQKSKLNLDNRIVEDEKELVNSRENDSAGSGAFEYLDVLELKTTKNEPNMQYA